MSGGPDRRRGPRRAEDRAGELRSLRRPNVLVRRAAVGLLAVVAVLLAVAVVALSVGAINDRHALDRAARALDTSNKAYAAVQQTQRNQAAGLVQSCERLNTKQGEDNRNQQADYFYDRIFLRLVRATPPRTAKQRRETREFLAPLRVAIRAKAWVPLVRDCGKVHLGYRLPQPVAFAVRQPPPVALAAPKR